MNKKEWVERMQRSVEVSDEAYDMWLEITREMEVRQDVPQEWWEKANKLEFLLRSGGPFSLTTVCRLLAKGDQMLCEVKALPGK